MGRHLAKRMSHCWLPGMPIKDDSAANEFILEGGMQSHPPLHVIGNSIPPLFCLTRRAKVLPASSYFFSPLRKFAHRIWLRFCGDQKMKGSVGGVVR